LAELTNYFYTTNTKQDYTAMITTVNIHDFREAFRTLRPENFSYDGLAALFDYLEELSEDMGEHIELDVISICCDWTEYESLEEYQAAHLAEGADMADIEYITTVIYIDGSDGFIALGH
jgi:hypothetical protein